jgi:hypothetical protein
MNISKLTLVGLLLCCFFITTAQVTNTKEEVPKKMKYGIGMALNYSEYSTRTIPPEFQGVVSDFYEPLVGFSLISSAERTLNSKFKLTIRPEIAFIGSGNRNFENEFRQVNVNLPLTIHYNLFNSFYVQGGVAGQFVAGWGIEGPQGFDDAIDVLDNRLLASVHLGVSYVISDWVDVGFTYNNGLTSLFNVTWTDINGNPLGESGTTNNYFQLAVIVRQ